MDFVLALHSHLPWVLHHGRWPHGSDWLCEAAVDTYLPLLDALNGLEREGVSAPVTLGITPVLAAQLSHPSFVTELDAFVTQRLAACEAAPASLATTGDSALLPLAEYWRDRLTHLRGVMRDANDDLIGAFGELQQRGRLELISSCATHGFLPLLGRDESIRLQLFTGRGEHKRLFGVLPSGLWLPECAYRPPGPWHPRGSRARAHRRGTAEFIRNAGFRYFFVDAHLPQAGQFLGLYNDVQVGTTRGDGDRDALAPVDQELTAVRSPYRPYRMPGSGNLVAALVRDPRSTRQVWSRHEGYPGDEWYLEFHKMRWPGGLKLWRVTGEGVDLGAKQQYEPLRARERALSHAKHFSWLLGEIAKTEKDGDLIVAPFDTELFGHWWFEGVDFIADVYREMSHSSVRPVTARAHVGAHPPRGVVRLGEGSWGANGDFSMWMNDQTAWTWARLWPIEDAFWDSARAALAGGPATRRVLEQAARSMLLAQASDWQFIISTGAATDYAEMRFALHCADAEQLLAGLAPGATPGALEEAVRRADALKPRDDLFPGVLDAVREALG
jgi:1,4-alpha-glucan branching enzyme